MILACACISFVAGAYGQNTSDCEELQATLNLRREKLAEYIDALRVSHERGDMRLIQAFSHKIDRLADEIRQAEEFHKCPKGAPATTSPGLSPIKTDAAAFVTESCGELRRFQVMLLIKINALRRRHQSVFSQLNSEEKDSLENAEEKLKNVRSALKARCPAEPARKKSGSRARSGNSSLKREVR